MTEDPQKVDTLGEGESNVARADRRQNAYDAFGEFVDPHTGPAWELSFCLRPEYCKGRHYCTSRVALKTKNLLSLWRFRTSDRRRQLAPKMFLFKKAKDALKKAQQALRPNHKPRIPVLRWESRAAYPIGRWSRQLRSRSEERRV